MAKRFATRQSVKRFARKVEDVEIVGDDGEVETFRLQELSGQDADEFGAQVFKEKVVEVNGKAEVRREVDTVELKAKLVARCWIGEDGERLYADDETAQLNRDWPAGLINKLFKVAEKMNGLDAAAVEQAGKNSQSGPGSASPTA